MSYDSVRLDEQMRVLDYSIDSFVLRYNAITQLPPFLRVNPARQTLFMFPGGTGSTLKRATRRWKAAGPASQALDYEVAFGDVPALLGGATRDLRMERRRPDGSYRDKGNRIVIADGLPNVFGVTPYLGFLVWCLLKQIDWFVFPWDWRLNVDDVGTFFIDRFLPHFQERVQNECTNADPLADYSLVGHSAGGLVVKLDSPQRRPSSGENLRKVITVAAPFYGYGGQLHRWFEGHPLVNGFPPFTPDYTKGIIKALSSFPGSYSWHFLPEGFYTDNRVAFQNDPAPLPCYPSVDLTTNNPADPYNPQPPAQRYPIETQSGFNGRAREGEISFPPLRRRCRRPRPRSSSTSAATLPRTIRSIRRHGSALPIRPSRIVDTSITPGDGTNPGGPRETSVSPDSFPATCSPSPAPTLRTRSSWIRRRR